MKGVIYETSKTQAIFPLGAAVIDEKAGAAFFRSRKLLPALFCVSFLIHGIS